MNKSHSFSGSGPEPGGDTLAGVSWDDDSLTPKHLLAKPVGEDKVRLPATEKGPVEVAPGTMEEPVLAVHESLQSRFDKELNDGY